MEMSEKVERLRRHAEKVVGTERFCQSLRDEDQTILDVLVKLDTLRGENTLLKSANAQSGSLLLDVQKECCELRKEMEAAKAEIKRANEKCYEWQEKAIGVGRQLAAAREELVSGRKILANTDCALIKAKQGLAALMERHKGLCHTCKKPKSCNKYHRCTIVVTCAGYKSERSE